MWSLKDLTMHAGTVIASYDGRNFYPARPEQAWGFMGLKLRIKDAWEVFRGRAEAFYWPADPKVCKVVTTNAELKEPGTTLGDVVLGEKGDVVLLTAQTQPDQNGLWIWNGPSVPMTRIP